MTEPNVHPEAASDAEPDVGSTPAFNELRQRCDAAEIEFVQEEFTPQEIWRSLMLPRGRGARQAVSVNTVESVAALLAFPFERVRFLGAYDAVAFYDTGDIEAAVRQTGSGPNLRSEALARLHPDLVAEDGSFLLRLSDPERAPHVTIEVSSPTSRFTAVVRGPLRQRHSLKISGLAVSQHDVALNALETISDALFFDLDRTRGIALELLRTRRAPTFRRLRTGRARPPLRLPGNRYDHEAVSLYRYARAARGMPLLQFLGYYQVIEFYMPRYTQAEARRRVEILVKDPGFNPHDGRDVTRLMNVAKEHTGALGSRDERSQLKLTLRECVDAVEIAAFLDESPPRGEFFARKNPTLTRYQVSSRNQTMDLREQVAERIYDLRCKIVHTKDFGASDQIELLLPNSAEAEMLQDDIELLRFLATKILVAASDSLTYRHT